jgi:hypothetical protein
MVLLSILWSLVVVVEELTLAVVLLVAVVPVVSELELVYL